jgi:hypothetical protein
MQIVADIALWFLRGVCALNLFAGAPGYFAAGLAPGLLILSPAPAQANWLTKLARGAGETARSGARGLERASAHLSSLPVTASGAALAAHATPEGHWQFANRAGDVFTAGTPDELRRVVPTLLPDATGTSKLALYLSEESIFGDRALLKDLPEGASLRIVAGNDSYPLIAGSGEQLFAAVRPNLKVELLSQEMFDEALALLERPLARSQIRTLALEPGAPQSLSSAPRIDPATHEALIDAIDPAALPGALSGVRGQTVLLTGRVEDNLLLFRPAAGGEQSMKLTDLMSLADAYDVNLVILQAPVPRQPGGRNWLWQRINVGGLDDALKRSTFADFLDALAANHGTFRVSASRDRAGRIALRSTADGATEPLTGMIGNWLSSAISSMTGNVVATAVDVHARDAARQREIDRRIVPFIPFTAQVVYLVAMVAGLIGLSVAGEWWQRIWPTEQRTEYGSEIGYRAAQAVRLVVFLLVFLPATGIPAVIVWVGLQFIFIALVPVRIFGWLTGRTASKAG